MISNERRMARLILENIEEEFNIDVYKIDEYGNSIYYDLEEKIIEILENN